MTAEQLGIAGLLLAAISSLVGGLWYPATAYNQMKAQYEERLNQAAEHLAFMREDRDEYRKLVLELLPINREALKLAEQTAKRR